MRAFQLSPALGLLALLWSSPARADQTPGHERTDLTAYTLRQNEFSVGLWRAAYGVVDQVMVGTYVPTWFAVPWLGSPIATGFIKGSVALEPRLAVSAQAGFAYLDADVIAAELSDSSVSASDFLAVPLELSISMRVAPRFSASLQGTWTYIGAAAELPLDDSIESEVGGAVATSTLSASLLLELRLTRVFALTLHESLRVWQAGLVTHGTFEQNATTVDFDLEVPQNNTLMGNVVPGVAFSWQHVNLQLGVGYGNNWLPVVRLPLPKRTLVLELDCYVRF